MFWSKIWFFLIAVAGAAALVIALLLPRPAQRERLAEEERRLAIACEVVNILMRDNARSRIELTRNFAAREGLDEILMKASGVDTIDPERKTTARVAAKQIIGEMTGSEPDFVLLLDNRGRVVTRIGYDESEFGDSMAGYYVIDDALSGFLRDDLWYLNDKLYRVAAAPVIQRQPDRYAGAVVLGYAISKDFAKGLVGNLAAEMAFYVNGKEVAASGPLQVEERVVSHYRSTLASSTDGIETDCRKAEPLEVGTGGTAQDAVLARLPGEAGQAGAFYAVIVERPKALGLMATLDTVTKSDLGFGHFPWIPVGLGLLLCLGGGFALMIFEADRPLRKLAADAVKLAQGEAERLDEDGHRGKYGSVARSVNIHIDKLQRDAKSAKKDLDQLLGPAPEGPSALPPIGPGGTSGAFKPPPPPPSEFRFNDQPSAPPLAGAAPSSSAAFELDLPPPPSTFAPPAPAKQPPPRPAAPPPPVAKAPPVPREKTPPPKPNRAATPPPPLDSLDDDILGDVPALVDEADEGPTSVASIAETKRVPNDFDAPTRVADPSSGLLAASAQSNEDDAEQAYFRKVFDEFVALKQQCGEPTASLTFSKFAAKLRKNRDALIDKHGCKEVKFQVYAKDGKAALKATPLKG